MNVSFSIAGIVLGFLPALALADMRDTVAINSNVISIVITREGEGVKIKEINVCDKDGETPFFNDGNRFGLEFEKTKVQIVGLSDRFKERLTVSVDTVGDADSAPLASFEGNALDMLTTAGMLFANAGAANEVEVTIKLAGDTSPRKFKARGRDAASQDNVARAAEEATVCDDPAFYESAYLEPIRDSKQNGKPYYVIEQNMTDNNSGPRIWLYKSDPEPKGKEALRVGKNAVVFVKNAYPTYSKVTVKQTFENYHLEDQHNFKRLLTAGVSAGGEPEGEDSNAGEVDLTEEKPMSPVDKAGKKLSEDLQRFLDDIQQGLPSMETVNRAWAKTKDNIARCFGNPEGRYASADKLLQVLKTAGMSEEWVEKIYRKMVEIESYQVYRTVPFPIQNADAMILTTYYHTEDEQVAVDSSSFSLPISGGFKIDFSTGFLFSRLVNRRYAIADADPEIREETDESGNVTTEEIQRMQVIEEVPDKHNFGIAVLAHCYPRLTQWFSVAFTGGFMLQNDEAVQFPLGASFLIGKRPRLALTVGGIFGSVKTLSNRYQLNTPVEATKLNSLSADQLTTTAARRSWFIGISYNFGGVRIVN